MPRGLNIGRAPPEILELDNQSILEEFLETLASTGASSETIKAYYSAIKDFLEYIGEKRLRDIKITDINKWKLERIRKGFPRSRTRDRRAWMTTLHYYTLFIRRFLKWLGLDIEVPVTKKPVRRIEALTEEEVRKLLNSCRDLLDKVILRILLDTGLRSRELLGIRVNDIDLNNREIVVRETKYGRERRVLVTQETIEVIKTWIRVRELKGEDRIIPLTYSGLYKRVKKLAYRAGVKPEKLRPHILRHTFATQALRKGMNLFALQRLLGHNDIKTTQVYTHLTIDDIRREYEKALERESIGVKRDKSLTLKYCPNCGKEWFIGARYCPFCGFDSKRMVEALV